MFSLFVLYCQLVIPALCFSLSPFDKRFNKHRLNEPQQNTWTNNGKNSKQSSGQSNFSGGELENWLADSAFFTNAHLIRGTLPLSIMRFLLFHHSPLRLLLSAAWPVPVVWARRNEKMMKHENNRFPFFRDIWSTHKNYNSTRTQMWTGWEDRLRCARRRRGIKRREAEDVLAISSRSICCEIHQKLVWFGLFVSHHHRVPLWSSEFA
jgi:hypothetical protein